MSVEIEHQLLGRLLHNPQEYRELTECDVHPEYFEDDNLRDIFKYSLEHHDKYKKLPDHDTIVEEFSVSFKDQPEPVTFYADKVLDKASFNVQKMGINTAAESLEDGDQAKSLGILEDTFLEASKIKMTGVDIYSIGDIEPAMEHYEKLKELDGEPTGIPLPWEPITRTVGGWQPGDSCFYTARTGIGKSWMLLMNAHSAWMAGYKTLTISCEMLPRDMQTRLYSYIAEVPYGRLTSGTLGKLDEERMYDIWSDLDAAGNLDVVGFNQATNLANIEALIQTREPEILFIDALYYVTPNEKKYSEREARATVATEIKKLAMKYNIPIICSVQLNRAQKEDAKILDLSNLFGTDAYAQNGDVVIGMLQTNQMRQDEVLNWSILKNRRGLQAAAQIEWDMESMAFGLLQYEEGTKQLSPTAEDPDVEWEDD